MNFSHKKTRRCGLYECKHVYFFHAEFPVLIKQGIKFKFLLFKKNLTSHVKLLQIHDSHILLDYYQNRKGTKYEPSQDI